VQGPRAREVLTELVPALLEAFSGSGDPDAALLAFDEAMTRMPAAVELFSILKSNANVRELFADILGGAPRLANVVAQRPHVLDAAIDPAVARAPVDETIYDKRVARMARDVPTTEAFLDGARDIAQEEMFLIGVRALSGVTDTKRAGREYAGLAQDLLRATLARVESDFGSEYGGVPGGRCVVVGMGRLGSREMTATSDLDLILIYDFPERAIESDGPRRIHPAQYYTRLTQRLVTALTAATRRGKLYDVDLRLRPSGGKGPVATRFSGFLNYQKSEAETWEHMALTRARVVAGEESLSREVEAAIVDILRAPRDYEKLRRDAREMRELIASEKGEDDPWDLKLAAGGLVDIEFIAQYLVLRHARDHADIRNVDCESVFAAAGRRDLVPNEDADDLIAAYRLISAITQLTRMAIEARFNPDTAAPAVMRRIATAVALPDFRTLEASLGATRKRVRSIFKKIFES
jgi:glutamate-ammonia-ligase adenylyltransferase